MGQKGVCDNAELSLIHESQRVNRQQTKYYKLMVELQRADIPQLRHTEEKIGF